MKFGAVPKGELEVMAPVWNNDLPLLGPGTNRWFYECRSKDGGPTIVIQEKCLKQADGDGKSYHAEIRSIRWLIIAATNRYQRRRGERGR